MQVLQISFFMGVITLAYSPQGGPRTNTHDTYAYTLLLEHTSVVLLVCNTESKEWSCALAYIDRFRKGQIHPCCSQRLRYARRVMRSRRPYYANLIRTLTLTPDDEHYEPSVMSLTFAGTRSVHFGARRRLQQLDQFLHPGLHHIGTSSRQPVSAQDLALIQLRCPGLQSISLDGFRSDCPPDALIGFMQNCRHLRSIKISHNMLANFHVSPTLL